MDQPRVSRRNFLGQVGLATATGAVPVPATPSQAWIIVALGWEYNDEVSFPAGAHPQPEIYYDEQQALAACRQKCDEFFAAQTPAEFEIDWDQFGPDPTMAGYDEASVTWDEVRALGFPDPYYVLELQQPGGPAA